MSVHGLVNSTSEYQGGSAASVLVTAMNDEQSPAAAAGATLRARRRLVCLLSYAVRQSDRVAVQQ